MLNKILDAFMWALAGTFIMIVIFMLYTIILGITFK